MHIFYNEGHQQNNGCKAVQTHVPGLVLTTVASPLRMFWYGNCSSTISPGSGALICVPLEEKIETPSKIFMGIGRLTASTFQFLSFQSFPPVAKVG